MYTNISFVIYYIVKLEVIIVENDIMPAKKEQIKKVFSVTERFEERMEEARSITGLIQSDFIRSGIELKIQETKRNYPERF